MVQHLTPQQIQNTLPPPPAPKAKTPTSPFVVMAIAFGILGFVILPIVFGPLALVMGVVAVSQGHRVGWVGVALGGVQLLIVLAALAELSNALNSL